MIDNVPNITTHRLELVSLSLEFYRAAERLDALAAQQILNAPFPDELLKRCSLYTYRRKQLEADPFVQPWLLRAIFLKGTSTIIGRIGFHDSPKHGAAELGYEICAAYRRRGYAEESIRSMMAWAAQQRAVRCFVLSISPQNEASLALAAKLGFDKVGEQLDDEDGPEDIFELPCV